MQSGLFTSVRLLLSIAAALLTRRLNHIIEAADNRFPVIDALDALKRFIANRIAENKKMSLLFRYS
ncbi:hypothetical protein BTO30_13190 [Domibacillus antri]|uniref:Uncharacterized protein n=1 Tax=Domibacillus antri TaxID=1714264 RepID=A0A1Q8Q3C9_9BACI|nr:hypothetical protein BTO30_13190 [Domibacillus antri]